MKRLSRVVVFLAALCVLAGVVYAAKSQAQSEEERLEEMRKKVAEKREELNGSEWEISIQPQAGTQKASVPATDTLTFQNSQFLSAQMSKKGFARTNYTVTVQGEGPAIWETMQTSADKEQGIAFWRGEWKEEALTGVIVRQIPEKPNEEYYFTSSARKSIPRTSSKEGEEEGKEKARSLTSGTAQESSADSVEQAGKAPSSTYVTSPSGEKKEKKRLASFW